MSINHNVKASVKAAAYHSRYLTKTARLPLAVVGVLLSAQVSAFLPTPSSVVEGDARQPVPLGAEGAATTVVSCIIVARFIQKVIVSSADRCF